MVVPFDIELHPIVRRRVKCTRVDMPRSEKYCGKPISDRFGWYRVGARRVTSEAGMAFQWSGDCATVHAACGWVRRRRRFGTGRRIVRDG